MKKLSDMKLLAGEVEEISMTEFRKLPGEVIAQVEAGKTFRITKLGRVIAVISQPEPSAAELGAEVRRLGLV